LHDQASLLSFLNLSERGADTLILNLGSDSIKFGLASQQTPFIAPTVIAHARKDGKRLWDGPQMDREVDRQARFDAELDRALPEIEHALRKKRFLLIDAKSAKSIRNKQVSFKVYEEGNAVMEYNEVGEDSFLIGEQSVMLSDMHPNIDKFAFINLSETQSPNTYERPGIFVGREALALHKNEEYILRYPIRYGDLNVSENYNIH
jgi:actin-related protein